VLALLVRFEVAPEHIAAFDELTARTLAAIANDEPGTIIYVTHERPDFPAERVFYEAYADQAAFDAHEAGPHTMAFLAERVQYLTSDPEVWWLTSIDGVH
jgi:quinol monooxygenase YgiN